MKNFLLALSFYCSVKSLDQISNKNAYNGSKMIYAVAILKPDNNSGVDGLVKMFYDG